MEDRGLGEVEGFDLVLSSSGFLPSFQKSRFRGFVPSDSVDGMGVSGSFWDLVNKGALEFLDSELAPPSSSRLTAERVDILGV
jgi:hypothetical protein